MDPNIVLDAVRNLLDEVDNNSIDDPMAHLEAIRDTFDALDKWITTGGFLPKDWSK